MASKLAAERAQAIEAELPYLRRYARALTGNQVSGDTYAAATLEYLLAEPRLFEGFARPKLGLFHAFHRVWTEAGAPMAAAEAGLAVRAQAHMAGLTPNSREALLLCAIEGFEVEEIAAILRKSEPEVRALLAAANQEMAESVTGRVMVIEDEAIIAMDIVDIVTTIGHRVTGVARTRDGAVTLALREPPDLILADIQLADNSSGIDAVNDILRELGPRPVIFITAFPERMLTGTKPEPAFLISKPFSEEELRSAVSQAMFFASTEPLNA